MTYIPKPPVAFFSPNPFDVKVRNKQAADAAASELLLRLQMRCHGPAVAGRLALSCSAFVSAP